MLHVTFKTFVIDPVGNSGQLCLAKAGGTAFPKSCARWHVHDGCLFAALHNSEGLHMWFYIV